MSMAVSRPGKSGIHSFAAVMMDLCRNVLSSNSVTIELSSRLQSRLIENSKKPERILQKATEHTKRLYSSLLELSGVPTLQSERVK